MSRRRQRGAAYRARRQRRQLAAGHRNSGYRIEVGVLTDAERAARMTPPLTLYLADGSNITVRCIK